MKPTGGPTRSTSPLEVLIIRKISRQRRMFTRRNVCPGSISSTVEFVSHVHVYEVHPRKDRRRVDLISDVLPVRSPVVFDSLGAPRHARVGESARVLIRPLRSPNPKP